MKTEGKVIIVTGGGSGLGAATAERLIRAGARVVLADINVLQGEAQVKRLNAHGEHAMFIATDVTQESSVTCLIDKTCQWGELRGVVNCAGIATGARVVGRDGAHSLADFTRTLTVNLIGSFNVLRLAAQAMSTLPALEDGERGVIVSTASVAAYDGQIGQAAYSASKGGIVAMTLPIARELAKFGIRVMTLAPGIMETPMMADMSDEVRASLGSQVPFPARLGKPQEFADLVAHIFANSYLNGETIRLDGAIRLAPK